MTDDAAADAIDPREVLLQAVKIALLVSAAAALAIVAIVVVEQYAANRAAHDHNRQADVVDFPARSDDPPSPDTPQRPRAPRARPSKAD